MAMVIDGLMWTSERIVTPKILCCSMLVSELLFCNTNSGRRQNIFLELRESSSNEESD